MESFRSSSRPPKCTSHLGIGLDMFPDAAQGKHLCLDCGIDISHRRRDAQRCEPCSNSRTKELAGNYYWENRTRVLQRIKSRQQTPEYKQLRREWEGRNPEKFPVYRQRQKQKHREKTGYNPEGRTCDDCDADISHRGHRAKRCVSCSMPPVRACMVCHIDISHKGARTQFCSQQCKQQDQRSKELKGYTKICTKCNEEKQYSEFGLHYNLGRSVCKICEASATRGYFQGLPVEERRKRRRIQGERERIKKASIPPEQKTILRTEARQAHRRRLYGPDFNEDRLYSEQKGKCAICGIPELLEELELDHDHVTGMPRGLLCKNCNFKLLPRYERFPLERQDSPYLNEYLKKGKQQ